ncbi:hypothetical protein A6P39_000405 [Streptomyces sp. FXJ1.172]|uniref:hypothetical protein n=1 Tax=Streptomyces sp. FXJ1.172 TaxID=710705 RepID=UPI0007CFFFB4|nr:hypothetical protein [Streptomyces sp. FXJ1.172]WEO92710.1 hypothetical protein A6P39_000405 [Streptomyces sp. FXJ1.172]
MKKTALPKMLSFAAPDLREQIEALPASTALIGISTDGRAIAVDLDAECPHVLVCTASGGGSTTILRSLTAQFLYQGALLAPPHLAGRRPGTAAHLASSPTAPTETPAGADSGGCQTRR